MLKEIALITVMVLSVQDGDTITVKSKQSPEPFKIRMAKIDCPEKKQNYGAEATSVVSKMLLNKSIQLKAHNKDLYGRMIGEVYLNGLNLNQYLVQMGHCWVYMSKDENLIDLEHQARSLKVGLWAEEKPVPPWEYRKSKRR